MPRPVVPAAASYDLRLFNRRGAVILFYRVVCTTAADAAAKIPGLDALPYSRLELWLDDDLLKTVMR